MATDLKEAFKRWEEENKSSVRLATELILSFCRPPIQTLDNSLSMLTSVEMLSLSSNCIEKITGFQKLPHLRILSLSRNNIKDLSGLEVLGGSLEQLWISYNLVEKLKALVSLKKLKVLYIAHNAIKDWAEIQRLQKLPALTEVLFLGNPFTDGLDEEKYMAEVSKRLPNLKTIDGETVLSD